MPNLISRTLSALVALVILIAMVYFFAEKGTYALILFASVRGSYEIARMVFKAHYPKFATYAFVLINLATFLLLTLIPTKDFQMFFILLSFAASVVVGIVFHKKFNDLQTIFDYVSQSAFGTIYTAVIPAIVSGLVYSQKGMHWFFCLLAVIFAGDIGAYLFGVTMGNKKVAPTLSPKKSLEGAIGGLIFSTLAAYAFSFILTDVALPVLLLCGFFGGLLGQIGDFFESLIKRVSGVKDSGTIMPGHGGVLDRIDGVLLASPLFYFAANYHSLWS